MAKISLKVSNLPIEEQATCVLRSLDHADVISKLVAENPVPDGATVEGHIKRLMGCDADPTGAS